MSQNDKKKLRLKALQIKEANEKKLKEYLSCPEHKLPTDRRQFLASGLISMGIYSTLPTMASLFSQAAQAQDLGCPASSAANEWPVFINLHLGGGPALFANHLISSEGGMNFNNFGGYGKLGMGPNPASTNIFKNNAPFWNEIPSQSKGSGILKGLKNTLGPSTELWNSNNTGSVQKNTLFVAAAAKSVDDTRASNREEHDLTGLLQSIGVVGSSLPYLFVGAGNYVGAGGITNTGFKSLLAAEPNYLKVISEASISNALTPTIEPTLLTKPEVTKSLFELIMNLSKKQMDKLIQTPNSLNKHTTFSKLMNCAINKNNTIVQNQSTNLNLDTDIWGTDKTSTKHKIGIAVSQCMRGLSASTSIHLGGYDYHLNQVNSRAAADQLDVEAGEHIGNILKTAHKHGKKLFLYVSADGSVNSPQKGTLNENVPWRGDYGLRGVNYIIAYDPSSKTEAISYTTKNGKLYDESWQLNHFVLDKNGLYRVNTSNPLHDIKISGGAVFLNYLSFAGKLDAYRNKPQLAKLIKMLSDAVPTTASNFDDYYLRMKST